MVSMPRRRLTQSIRRSAAQGPPADKAGSRTVTLTERFYCRPPDLFEALTDERRISAYTQVTASAKPGLPSSSCVAPLAPHEHRQCPSAMLTSEPRTVSSGFVLCYVDCFHVTIRQVLQSKAASPIMSLNVAGVVKHSLWLRHLRQSEAKSDVRPGGVFSMFNGTVSGTYREVEPPGRIVMDWRFNHWPDGVLSKVRPDSVLVRSGSG